MEIPQDLKKLKESLDGKIDGMKSASSTIQSKISGLVSATNTAKSGIDSNYDSSNKAVVLSSFDNLSSSLSKVSSSLSGDMDSILSLASTVIEEVRELEELEIAIEEQESKISQYSGKLEDESSLTAYNNARSEKDELETKFNKILSEAQSNLSTLRSMNPTIEIETSISTGGAIATGKVSEQFNGLEEGTYKKVDYTAENGRTITTYIYLPEGAYSVEDLGVALYMGGDGAKVNAMQEGVGYAMRHGQDYSGIVVVFKPEDDKSFSDPTYLDAAKELTDNLVKTLDADPNRISIAGYSYGGSGAQHMLERFPGYFAQGVILGQGTGAVGKESGGDKQAGIDKIKQTKIHLMCGTLDNVREDGNNLGSLNTFYNDLLNAGGIVTYEWRKGADHNTINDQGSIEVNGKEYANYIEFCLSQTKA